MQISFQESSADGTAEPSQDAQVLLLIRTDSQDIDEGAQQVPVSVGLTWTPACRERKTRIMTTKAVIRAALPAVLLLRLDWAEDARARMDLSAALALLCCQLFP